MMMLRLDAPWMAPPPSADRNIRMAPATVVTFRGNGEFAELHCWLIEQPDKTQYVSSRAPRVAAIGTWKQHGDKVDVKRTSIARTVPLNAPIDPLCTEEPVVVHVSGNSVVGNVGATSDGTYAPVTQLVAPDFESYVSEARRSTIVCPVKK